MNKEKQYETDSDLTKYCLPSENRSIFVHKKDIDNICSDMSEHGHLKEVVNKLYHDKLKITIQRLIYRYLYCPNGSFMDTKPPAIKIYDNLTIIKEHYNEPTYVNQMTIFINPQKTLCYFKFDDNSKSYMNNNYSKFYLYDYFKDLIEDIELYNKMTK